MKTAFLLKCYPNLEKELQEEIENYSIVEHFKTESYVVKQGQYIRFLPIVLNGSIKVYSTEDTTQFLLYFISAGESCIYSFAHTFNKKAAEFSAKAVSDSDLLLLPINKVNDWLKKYPSFAGIVLQDYQKQYMDLLNVTKQIICYNLDERLVQYLRTKSDLEQSDLLSLTHQEIADDLGTTREVISRLMRKLSLSNKVQQIGRKIKIS